MPASARDGVDLGHGTEKLAATVEYLETTRKLEKAGEATALQFRVPGRGGRFESIPFEKASSNDILRARTLVLHNRRTSTGPADTRTPDDAANRRAAVLAAALSPASKAVSRGPRAEVVRDADGRHRYTFRAVAEEELEALARAILASLT